MRMKIACIFQRQVWMIMKHILRRWTARTDLSTGDTVENLLQNSTEIEDSEHM